MRGKGTSIGRAEKTMVKRLRDDLLRWICERQATDKPLSRELLRDKALGLTSSLGLTGFKCSNSWLTVFLKKYGFTATLVNSNGPKFEDYRRWVDLMKCLITQYRYKDLFHVDEMGMYNDVAPQSISPAAKNTTDRNAMENESRVTVLLCCNAAGTEKLPPLICGRHNFDAKRNHGQYHHNEDAWLTEDIFNDWLTRLNDRLSKVGRRILLMLHRCRVHVVTRGTADLSHVNLMYFPRNFPPNLRPLKRNIFHYVKMVYRQNYTRRMRESNHGWNMMDTINNIHASWERVPKDLIVSSFRRTRFRTDEDVLNITFCDWDTLRTGISFKRYVTFDDDLSIGSPVVAPTSNTGSRYTGSGHDLRPVASLNEVIQIDDSNDSISVAKVLNTGSDRKEEDNGIHAVGNEYGFTKLDDKKSPSQSGTTSGVHDSDSERSYSNLGLDLEDSAHICKENSDEAMHRVSGVVGSALENAEHSGGIKVDTPAAESGPSLELRASRKRRADSDDGGDRIDDDDSSQGPDDKKKKTLNSWADVYRKNFVFGQSVQNVPRTYQPDAFGEDCIIESCKLSTDSQMRMNDETEKRSILTIGDNSPGPSISSKQ